MDFKTNRAQHLLLKAETRVRTLRVTLPTMGKDEIQRRLILVETQNASTMREIWGLFVEPSPTKPGLA